MIKIDTTTKIKNVKGEVMKDGDEEITLGMVLSAILLGSKEKGKMKLFTLATKIYQEPMVEVDESDFAMIKNVVKNTETYGVLIAGQVELILESLK